MIHYHIPHLLRRLPLRRQLNKKLLWSLSSFRDYLINAFNNLMINEIYFWSIILYHFLCPIERESILFIFHLFDRLIILLFQSWLTHLSKVAALFGVILACLGRCLAEIVFISVFIIPFLHLFYVWFILRIFIHYAICILSQITVSSEVPLLVLTLQMQVNLGR